VNGVARLKPVQLPFLRGTRQRRNIIFLILPAVSSAKSRALPAVLSRKPAMATASHQSLGASVIEALNER
jgi:hypothetical protein